VRNGSGYTGLCNGLSRMKGNFHVRFLGEGVVATPLPYPTQREKGRLNRCQSSRVGASRFNGSKWEPRIAERYEPSRACAECGHARQKAW
jgi:hypothetical protein